MSQVWPLRTAFKGREASSLSFQENIISYYHPRTQRAAVRLGVTATQSWSLSLAGLCGRAVSPAASSGGLQEIHPAPWGSSLSAFPSEEGLMGRGRRLATFNFQVQRNWIPEEQYGILHQCRQWWPCPYAFLPAQDWLSSPWLTCPSHCQPWTGCPCPRH